MTFFVVLVYVILIVLNYRSYAIGRNDKLLSVVSSIVSILFLCGANVAFNDNYIGELDLASYRNGYDTKDLLLSSDFSFYYLFFYSIKLGQLIGLSFAQWWFVMSLCSIAVIYMACKVHKYNYHLVIASFMAYYAIVFYSGLKFYYGFVFLLMAYGYLIRDTRKDKLLYTLFVCIAGGFHVMYYMFLLLLIKPIKNPKRFVKTIVIISVLGVILMRITGSVMVVMKPFFDVLESERIDTYVNEATGYGFYLAILLELVMINIPSMIRKWSMLHNQSDTVKINAFYYSVLLTLLFCPFYAVTTTFVRLITCFSMVVIAAGSSFLNETAESRKTVLKVSILMVASYILKNFFLDAYYGDWIFYNQSVKTYFDIF